MAVPTKEEAVQIATMNMEQDAGKYWRRVEALLMTWDGKAELSIVIPADERHMIPYLSDQLKAKGFTTRMGGANVWFK